jgi:dTDP-glucose pyrophosphorylase
MIILTLAGNSTRFFNNGYNIIKYKLLLGEKTIIESILDYLPKGSKLIVIINEKFNDFIFFDNLLTKMNFKDFKIIELKDTLGQLDTVFKGLKLCSNFFKKNDSVVVYNGDTIRKNYNWNIFPGDGYIEVFNSDGDHWSFVDKIGRVGLVTEKKRISSFCSSGLYYFNSAAILMDNIEDYIKTINSEIYIAPFYNYLIAKGLSVHSGLVSKNEFIFCGTPDEYEVSKFKYMLKKQR